MPASDPTVAGAIDSTMALAMFDVPQSGLFMTDSHCSLHRPKKSTSAAGMKSIQESRSDVKMNLKSFGFCRPKQKMA